MSDEIEFNAADEACDALDLLIRRWPKSNNDVDLKPHLQMVADCMHYMSSDNAALSLYDQRRARRKVRPQLLSLRLFPRAS
jgi:hypothetical protein